MPDNPLTRDEVLFPEIDPYASGRLAVDARHALFWECCGNARGVPLVFLHGGPGGGCLPHHRRYFDPAFWHIVLFDQRGAGRSMPIAEVSDNTTAHLIADLERLREHLGIDRWAAVRRLVGLDAGARVRRGSSRALPRPRAR